MADQKHNGWTNYATWRVNLEIFDGWDGEGVSPSYLQEYAKDVIDQDATGLAADYAHAFICNVNWHEIAAHINDELEWRRSE